MDKQKTQEQKALASLALGPIESLKLQNRCNELEDALIKAEESALVYGRSGPWRCDICDQPKKKHKRICPFALITGRQIVNL